VKAGLFFAAWFTCSVVLGGAWVVWAELRRRARSPFGPIRSGLVVPLEAPDSLGWPDYCICSICTGPDVA
jgi:hypothetical protein